MRNYISRDSRRVSLSQRRPCFDDAATHSRAILRYLRDGQSMESSGHADAIILMTNEAVADVKRIFS